MERLKERFRWDRVVGRDLEVLPQEALRNLDRAMGNFWASRQDVKGQEELPSGGHQTCPLAATKPDGPCWRGNKSS